MAAETVASRRLEPGAFCGHDRALQFGLGAGLNPNGRMVAVGAMAGDPPADFGLEMFAAFQKSMSFATFSGNTVTEADRRAVTSELFAAAIRGEIDSVVHEVLPLERAVLAHQKMQAGEVFGRIVLAPSGPR